MAVGNGVEAQDGQMVAGVDFGGDVAEDGGFADAAWAGQRAGQAAAFGEEREPGDRLFVLVAGEEIAPVDGVEEGIAFQIPIGGVHRHVPRSGKRRRT